MIKLYKKQIQFINTPFSKGVPLLLNWSTGEGKTLAYAKKGEAIKGKIWIFTAYQPLGFTIFKDLAKHGYRASLSNTTVESLKDRELKMSFKYSDSKYKIYTIDALNHVKKKINLKKDLVVFDEILSFTEKGQIAAQQLAGLACQSIFVDANLKEETPSYVVTNNPDETITVKISGKPDLVLLNDYAGVPAGTKNIYFSAYHTLKGYREKLPNAVEMTARTKHDSFVKNLLSFSKDNSYIIQNYLGAGLDITLSGDTYYDMEYDHDGARGLIQKLGRCGRDGSPSRFLVSPDGYVRHDWCWCPENQFEDDSPIELCIHCTYKEHEGDNPFQEWWLNQIVKVLEERQTLEEFEEVNDVKEITVIDDRNNVTEFEFKNGVVKVDNSTLSEFSSMAIKSTLKDSLKEIIDLDQSTKDIRWDILRKVRKMQKKILITEWAEKWSEKFKDYNSLSSLKLPVKIFTPRNSKSLFIQICDYTSLEIRNIAFASEPLLIPPKPFKSGKTPYLRRINPTVGFLYQELTFYYGYSEKEALGKILDIQEHVINLGERLK